MNLSSARPFALRGLFAASLIILSGTALAQTAAGTVQREINQETRILNGLKDGSLTAREAARLERGQAHVDQLQTRALRDGSLSGAERRRLDAAQDAASRHIYRSRHNGVVRKG
ncbi:MAG: hypothetical protein JNJ71_00560 [Rubrivivax sp.]|nr:hypothetical protein [Rubrivivax sp.]